MLGAYATVGSYARPTIISRHITLPKLHPGNILKPQHQEHGDNKGLGKADDYQPDHLWKTPLLDLSKPHLAIPVSGEIYESLQQCVTLEPFEEKPHLLESYILPQRNCRLEACKSRVQISIFTTIGRFFGLSAVELVEKPSLHEPPSSAPPGLTRSMQDVQIQFLSTSQDIIVQDIFSVREGWERFIGCSNKTKLRKGATVQRTCIDKRRLEESHNDIVTKKARVGNTYSPVSYGEMRQSSVSLPSTNNGGLLKDEAAAIDLDDDISGDDTNSSCDSDPGTDIDAITGLRYHFIDPGPDEGNAKDEENL